MTPAATEIRTVHDVIAQLEHIGRQVRRRGRHWTAQCPAHDDNTHSLSVAIGDQHPFVLHCHAGCEFHDVMDVLQGKRPPAPLSGRSSSKRRRTRPERQRQVVAHYSYKNELGELLYTKLRLKPKSFRFERAGGRPGLPEGQRRVLYHLPELMAAPAGSLAFIVEGEKDADRLDSLGLLATCTDTGAGHWSAEFNRYFKDLIVVIIPDNDDAGRKHAQMVAEQVATAAQQVRVLDLPGLPEKGDVSDWLDAGNLTEELLTLCLAAPIWQPEEERETATRPEKPRRKLDKWPDPPAAATAGVVATLTTTAASLAPIHDSEGTYQDNPMKRHKWIVKHGNQILQEGEDGPVFLLELAEADYERFKGRQSDRRTRLGERREFFGVPQDDSISVFHTDEREGGDPLTLHRPAIYNLLNYMVDCVPDGRKPSGSTDWGKEYRGSRGDGRNKDEEAILERARFAVAVVKSKRKIRSWSGMKEMTVKEIKALASEKTRPDLVAMMQDELEGKQRKTVLSLLLSRIRMNAVQFWAKGKDALRKAASALEIRLQKSGRGSRKMDPIEAYERLVGTGIKWFTRTGRGAWTVFQEWILYNQEEDSHDSEQIVTGVMTSEGTTVRNDGKTPPETPPEPYFGVRGKPQKGLWGIPA